MLLKIISIFLVGIGVAGLLISVAPVKSICALDNEQQNRWKILGLLIMFFISGYLVFVAMLSMRSASFIDLLVASVLCGGGFFVAIIVRISELSIKNIKRIAALERHRSLHDSLTDLPNRIFLHDRISQAILEAKRNSTHVAILVMDIVRFKEINDALGHHYGDCLLQMIAPRLHRSIRDSDTVARLGGDEFAVVLPGVGLEKAIAISDTVGSEMEDPFLVEGHNLNISFSIGIALYPKHGHDSETILQRADVAMHHAKRSQAKFSVYDSEHDKYTLNRLMLTEELRQAIKKDQLVPYYQPIIDMSAGEICGVEALVRWQRHEEEIVSPDDFISLAEQTGLILPLTDVVIEKTLRQKAEWADMGFDLPISINISIKLLHDLSFPERLKTLLDKWRVDSSGLTLEITESSMMLSPDRTYEVISNLYGLGLNLSIDDFGTGYSSLAYLKQLPAAEIKIDKSFVMDMLEDDNDAVIVRSTIDLANNMGLNVVAEGVEDEATMLELQRLGCNVMQGHYLCPALPADKFYSKVISESAWKPKGCWKS